MCFLDETIVFLRDSKIINLVTVKICGQNSGAEDAYPVITLHLTVSN